MRPLRRIEGARLLAPNLSRHEVLVDVTLADGMIHALEAAGPATGTVDDGVLAAEGAWLMPGLWDAHTHPTDWAATRHRLDLSGCSDRGEVLTAVQAAIGNYGSDELIGTGLRHAAWPQRPDVGLLDAVTGAVPTVLISTDMHSAWFNSAALRRYQLAEPVCALVAEGPWFAMMPQVGTADQATRDRWVIEAGRAAAALGVVGIADFDPGQAHAAWRRRVAAGFDAHRVQASVWADQLDASIAARLTTGDPLPGTDGLVTMGRLKVISDGSLNTRTAWCHQPFTDGGHGAPNLPAAELAEVMARAGAAGIESAIHAIGDRAVSVALEAFERTGARGRIEHAQLVTDADVHRMARLGVRASIQPGHTVADRDLVDLLWSEQAPRAYRFADLHRAGVSLDLGSDAPVSPLDPWHAISAAVHRTDDDRPPWHPEQRLDLATALRASWGPVSEIAAGGPADLVLLDRHPDSVLTEDRTRPQVLATVCAGRLTHY